MKESLKTYIKELESIKNIKKDTLEDLLLNIKIYQHERLVHLIVTFFVGIAAILFLCFGLLLENIEIIILFFLAFMLFVPYIFYYYFLENNVQKLYKIYFKLKKKCN